MLYNLLTDAVDKTRAVPIPEVALLAILGYAIVFFGIAFLIGIVWGGGQLMIKTKGKSFTFKKKKEETPAPAETPEVSTVEEDINDETVAVIMAALMAYYQQTNAKCDFTVKRIKRI